jgi:hypothetical protein
LLEPFRPRPGFTPIARHQAMKRLANRLRRPPALCRLRSHVKFEAGRLRVIEIWLVPARIAAADWDDDEPAVAISLRSLTIDPPAYEEEKDHHRRCRVARLGETLPTWV